MLFNKYRPKKKRAGAALIFANTMSKKYCPQFSSEKKYIENNHIIPGNLLQGP